MKKAIVVVGCLTVVLLAACVATAPPSPQALPETAAERPTSLPAPPLPTEPTLTPEPTSMPTHDLTDTEAVFEWEIKGDPHPLSAVRGLAVDQHGNLYVADCGGDRIQKFDSEGKFLTTWGSEGMEDGQFLLRYDADVPIGDVAVDAQGHVYVSDFANSRIQVFDSEGQFLFKWGEVGMGDGQFFMPVGVAVGPEGDVYVTDTSRRDVQRFDSEGNFLTKWNVPDIDYGPVVAPAADAEGNVYVPAAEVKEIQKYDGDGHLLARIGEAGPGLGQFLQPNTAAVDSQGNLYVTDEASHCVQVFGVDGNFLRRWGSMGNGEGELRAPSGLAVAPDGSVYVADSNDRIQKFRQE